MTFFIQSKVIVSLALVAAVGAFAFARATEDPAEKEVKRLVHAYGAKLKASRYMEQNPKPTTYPGYEGLPLVECTYSVKGKKDAKAKTAKVIMLNPPIEDLARWVVHTCVQVKGEAKPAYTDKLMKHIIGQSGGQFPVAGIVFEDILPADGVNEVFCFRDGVTVKVQGVKHLNTAQPTDKEIELSLKGPVVQAMKYARIQSTTREQYLANGGRLPTAGLDWLKVSRELYKASWKKDRNELMIAWAKGNL